MAGRTWNGPVQFLLMQVYQDHHNVHWEARPVVERADAHRDTAGSAGEPGTALRLDLGLDDPPCQCAVELGHLKLGVYPEIGLLRLAPPQQPKPLQPGRRKPRASQPVTLAGRNPWHISAHHLHSNVYRFKIRYQV